MASKKNRSLNDRALCAAIVLSGQQKAFWKMRSVAAAKEEQRRIAAGEPLTDGSGADADEDHGR